MKILSKRLEFFSANFENNVKNIEKNNPVQKNRTVFLVEKNSLNQKSSLVETLPLCRCNRYYSVSNENKAQKGQKVDFENPKV